MLCNSFKRLALDTWDTIDTSRRVNFQLKEETITDINMLALKARHPRQIRTKVFTKPEEGINGADWEWWFVNKARKCVGLRIQAKILNIDSNEFEHLHYHTKHSKIYQCDKLIKHSLWGKFPTYPLYCLYLQTNDPNLLKTWNCYSFSKTNDLFGCSLISAFEVRKLRASAGKSLKVLEPFINPWHCLICCTGYGNDDKLSQINSYASKRFPIDITQANEIIIPSSDLADLSGPLDLPDSLILPQPPPYVLQIIENEANDNISPPDKYIRGIVVYELDAETW